MKPADEPGAPPPSAGPVRMLFDTLPIEPSSGGQRVYVLQLLEELIREPRIEVRLLCSRSNAAVFARFANDVAIHTLPWATRRRPVRVMSQQIALPLVALRSRVDVVFAPRDVGPVLSIVPVVTAILSTHLNAQEGELAGQPLKRWYNQIFIRLTLRRSTRLVAISDFVKASLVQSYRTSPQRIDTVYLGGGAVERARRNGWVRPDPSSTGGMILFVSTLFPHKNADVLIRAYAGLHRLRGAAPPLHLAGRDVGGAAASLQTLAEDLGVREHVHYLGRVSDDDLLKAFEAATLLVYPSSIEGFGIPLVEAMHAGVPIVAADSTSIPEVVGDAALLVPPGDVPALTAAMEQVLSNAEVRARLTRAGAERGALFSWQRCARETVDVLERALGRRAPTGEPVT